jgi:hypothetical protein
MDARWNPLRLNFPEKTTLSEHIEHRERWSAPNN